MIAALSVILMYLGIFLAAAVLLPPILYVAYESDVWEYPPFSWYVRWKSYWFPY